MKKISIGPSDVASFIEEVKQKLAATKGIPEKIELYTNRSVVLKKDEHVELVFEDVAWRKMWGLINNLKSEVGWHGTVERDGDKRFVIKDILMFPQMVTGARVTTDDEKFATWECSLENEVYNKTKFYGHSHVSMPTNPSGIDTDYISNKIQNEQDFYIFGIFNKSKSHWLNIYDVRNNTLYENSDINLLYMQSPEDLWAEEQIKECVTEVKSTPPLYGKKNTPSTYGANSWARDDYYGKDWKEQWGGAY